MEHDFVVIAGAQKCGSSYLYHVLNDHPEILMAKMFPDQPETKYFIKNNPGSKGLDAYLERYFPDRSRYRVLGEKSVSYLPIGKRIAENIKTTVPQAKIVITLRDPVFRAISHYWYTENHGLEKRTLEEAFEKLVDKKPGEKEKNISYSPYSYLERGHYFGQIKTYVEIFGRDKIHLIVLEQFIKNPDELKRLYKFSGVESAFVPKSYREKVRESEKRGVEPSPALLKKLTDYFKKSNQTLADAYHLDLSDWLQ